VRSIEVSYSDLAAPGLARQDPFVEFKEGVRFRPSLSTGRLQFDYLLQAQQFVTSRDSGLSFRRTTIDLMHRIPIYGRSVSTGLSADFNGPNECAVASDSLECPPLSRSRDRSGTIGFRALITTSSTSAGNRVPFFFQPTLGGSDLNGERLLAAYDDYRFRGPQRLAFQESLEHSLWGPIGLFVLAEQGRTARERSELGFRGLSHSTAVGLTIRAGGMPLVNLSFAFGSEGHHIIGSMDTSLLGGGARPSLY
jgi:hypothetical protein